MSDVKQGLTAAGSVLLAAAASLPAIAQGPLLRRPVVSAAQRMTPRLERSGPPLSETMPIEPELPPPTEVLPPKAPPAVGPPVGIPTAEALPSECPPPAHPQRRFKPIANWLERHKAHCRDTLWGYPEEFQPTPLGAAVNANASLQVARAQETRMVLYQYAFLPQSAQLKTRGRSDLAKMTAWLTQGAGPVLVEPTPGRPDLDEARRLAVWSELQHGPCPVPLELIAIGRPEVLGLRGGEALLVDKNLMMQTSSRGTAMGGGGGGGSLLGGGGMGGLGGTTGGASGGTSSGSTGSTGMGY